MVKDEFYEIDSMYVIQYARQKIMVLHIAFCSIRVLKNVIELHWTHRNFEIKPYFTSIPKSVVVTDLWLIL